MKYRRVGGGHYSERLLCSIVSVSVRRERQISCALNKAPKFSRVSSTADAARALDWPYKKIAAYDRRRRRASCLGGENGN